MDNEKSNVIKIKPGTSLKNWRENYKRNMINSDGSFKLPTLHPSVIGVLQFFEYEHLPAELRYISEKFGRLAYFMAHTLPNNPELTKMLDKLREAKDRAVTAYLYKNPEDLDIG